MSDLGQSGDRLNVKGYREFMDELQSLNRAQRRAIKRQINRKPTPPKPPVGADGKPTPEPPSRGQSEVS